MPSGNASFTSAPTSSRARTASIRPSCTANSSAVNEGPDRAPRVSPTSVENTPPASAAAGSPVRAATWAPFATRVRTASALFSAAAHISAVWPRAASDAFGSAPAASNAWMTSTRPVRAAVISTVSPSASRRFGSAPAASSRVTMAALPFSAARVIGATP